MAQAVMARGLAKGRDLPDPVPVGRIEAHLVQKIDPVGNPAGPVLLELLDVGEEADACPQPPEAFEMRPDDATAEIGRQQAGSVERQDRQLRQEVGGHHEVDLGATAERRQRIDPARLGVQVGSDQPDVGIRSDQAARRPQMHRIDKVDLTKAAGQIRDRHVLEQPRPENDSDAGLI